MLLYTAAVPSISTPRVDPFSERKNSQGILKNPNSWPRLILGCGSHLRYVVRAHDQVSGTDKEGVGQRPSEKVS